MLVIEGVALWAVVVFLLAVVVLPAITPWSVRVACQAQMQVPAPLCELDWLIR